MLITVKVDVGDYYILEFESQIHSIFQSSYTNIQQNIIIRSA